MTCAIYLYVLSGMPTGYISSRAYKSFGGERWKSNALLTATLSPGIVFCLFFIMDLVLTSKRSSVVAPFATLVVLLLLWFGVLLPLTFLGAYFGVSKQTFEHPVETDQIPRPIPQQSIYTRPLTGIIFGGILPFVCILIQLFFILNSIWYSQIYCYTFESISLTFMMLIIICGETSILLCYYHLQAQDYRWWWRSYFTSSSAAAYFFLYCCHYFLTKMYFEDYTSMFLYFGYTLIMVFLFNLLTGSIGVFACFCFANKIYSGGVPKTLSVIPPESLNGHM